MTALRISKTYIPKPHELLPRWHVFDASQRPLGRMATQVARILQGKHRPLYTPNLNTGDFVIVINASRVMFTGEKLDQKLYRRHSGYPGGLRELTLRQMLQRNPTEVVREAVKGMLPKNTLGAHMLKRLKVYPGDTHPHQAQVASSGASKVGGVAQEAQEAQGGEQ
ncbi:MAG: 50S ribosomal protein L13 [Chloroflexi bacterium]|nr:50S ribosomal protein L13 [Chloroflexota bacterium]